VGKGAGLADAQVSEQADVTRAIQRTLPVPHEDRAPGRPKNTRSAGKPGERDVDALVDHVTSIGDQLTGVQSG
jgi:hypothetical protein